MDAERVAKSKFKAWAFEFFRQIEDIGSPVVVTTHGRPVVEVRRYHVDKRFPLETLKNSVVGFKRPHELVAEKDWEALR